MAHLLRNHDMAKLVRATGWRRARPPVARRSRRPRAGTHRVTG